LSGGWKGKCSLQKRYKKRGTKEPLTQLTNCASGHAIESNPLRFRLGVIYRTVGSIRTSVDEVRGVSGQGGYGEKKFAMGKRLKGTGEACGVVELSEAIGTLAGVGEGHL